MNVKILTILCVFILANVGAQNKLTFSYDGAGNQILRDKVCINCTTSKSASLKSQDSLASQKEIDDLNDVSYFETIVYPNPVTEFLQVIWQDNENKKPESLQLFSSDNKLVASFRVNTKSYQQDINFSNYPLGIYVLLVTYNDGQKETFKIIKK